MEQYRIAVQPPATIPWLGQEIALTIKVISAGARKPVANLPVSFDSTDLWISTPFGYEIREGRVVGTRTATDGSVRLALRTVFDERLTVDQFNALDERLSALDAAAPAPRDMREQFLQLVSQYEDERNRHLRSAMDIVYRSTGRLLAETVNQQDYLYAWRFHSSLLRIYLDSDLQPQSTPIEDVTTAQVGIHRISWKEWLLPWHQLYREQLTGSDLQQSLVDARDRRHSAPGLAAEILGQAYRFAARKNGLVGEALGKQVIEREIQHFLARETSSLPADTQRSLFPSLAMASRSISSSNTGTLALVHQNRADVEVAVDRRLGDAALKNDEALNSFGTRIDQLDGQLVDQAGRFGEVQAGVDKLRGEIGSLDTGLAEVRDSIGKVSSELGRIDTGMLQLDTRIGEVTGKFDRLDSSFNQITRSVETLNATVKQVDTNVKRMESGLAGVDTDLRKLKTELQDLDIRVSSVNTDFRTLDTQLTKLNRDVTELNTKAVLTTDLKRDARGNLLDINIRPIR